MRSPGKTYQLAHDLAVVSGRTFRECYDAIRESQERECTLTVCGNDFVMVSKDKPLGVSYNPLEQREFNIFGGPI